MESLLGLIHLDSPLSAKDPTALKAKLQDVAPQSCSPRESSETVKPLASFNLQFNIEVIDEQAIAGLQQLSSRVQQLLRSSFS